MIVGSVISAASVRPEFCGLCHTPQYDIWKASDHEQVRCNQCHRSPSMFSIAEQRLELAGKTLRYPLGLYRKPAKAFIFNASCLRCHKEILYKTVEKNNIRMSHKEHEEQGYRCTDCHQKTGHNESGIQKYSMELCINCHTVAKCETCHTKKMVKGRTIIARKTYHANNWQQIHGAADIKTCNTCHSDFKNCKECHKTEIPHSTNWLNSHGKQAIDDQQSCMACHKQDMCNKCHQNVEMPHKPNWLSDHIPVVKNTGEKTCYKCHHEDGCFACHERHKHPGVKKEIMKELRRKAGLP